MGNCYKLKNGSGCLGCKGCGRQDRQLNTYDWLADIPGNSDEQNMVEVQFKNTRKGYYINSNKVKIEKGDVVAVEATPGHDVGTVTLTGRLVPLQMKKANLKPDVEIKRIYRKVKPVDIEKYEEAKAKEHDTMIRSRQIAKDLNLNMKIGDVEYQGDGNKAIFYYIADERVDFRQLIKVLAETFRVRIEMKQIGARQEAGRIGGIGPCGRELCCSTWMTTFSSVSTTAARYQDISLNPQKLAGQCAKLKCCMNYEIDAYVEAQKRFPSREIPLETTDGTFYFFKADILKGDITYSTDKNFLSNATTISTRRAFEIINMNKRGEKPETLIEEAKQEPAKSTDLLDQESLTRFDKRKNNKKNKRKGENSRQGEDNQPQQQGQPRAQQQPNKGQNRPQQGARPQQEQGNRTQQGARSQQEQGNRTQQGARPQQEQGNRTQQGARPQQEQGNRTQQGARPQQGSKGQQSEQQQSGNRMQQQSRPQQGLRAQQPGQSDSSNKGQQQNRSQQSPNRPQQEQGNRPQQGQQPNRNQQGGQPRAQQPNGNRPQKEKQSEGGQDNNGNQSRKPRPDNRPNNNENRKPVNNPNVKGQNDNKE